MKRETVTIANKLGLHARASAKLVSLASQFAAEISLGRDGQMVNAKSIMGIMMLAAGAGSQLELMAEGQDESEAIAALRALIANRFGEDE
jgi:phosphocarrier protein